MNEAETRAEHIDPALKAAGWGVVEGSRIRREYLISPGRIEGRGRRGKPLIADYVLEYRNTKLAVNAAKAWDEELTEGAAQPQTTRTNLSPLSIRYPKSVTEQKRLAEQFESLTEETQHLARLYERKLASLDALKKSLLHHAFTGEL